MKKIIFIFLSVCFVFSFSSRAVLSARMVVPENGTLQNGNVKLQEKNQGMKNDFANTAQNYKDTRESYLQTRNNLQTKKDEPSKSELKKKSSEFISGSSAVMIKYLEALEDRVQNMNYVSELRKGEMSQKIEEQKSSIEKIVAEVKAAETFAKQRVIVSELKSEWRDIKASSKNITGQIIASKIDYFISKLEIASSGLQEKIDAIDAIENDELQSKILELNKKIELAKSENEKAQNIFSTIDNADQKNILFKEGMKYIREAHQLIKEAHKELLNISKELRDEKTKEINDAEGDNIDEKDIDNS